MKELTPAIVLREYDKKGRSFRDIADEYDTYPNKVKRMYVKAGGIPRDKSQAQIQALKSGRADHPTEGRQRTPEERERISEAVANEWQNASPEQREARSEASRRQWKKMSKSQREELLKKARDAARLAATEGSKLELAIKEAIKNEGYMIFHQYEDLLENPKLRIDIYLPEIATAIEVDGPSHFQPIWGLDNLQKNRRADQEKTGLLLAHGITVIRIRNESRYLSEKMKRDAVNKILKVLKDLNKSSKKLIEIEV